MSIENLLAAAVLVPTRTTSAPPLHNTSTSTERIGSVPKNSSTTVTGSQVGGGTSKKSNDNGTYTLSNGELTLKFSNGSTVKHSCFVSRPVGRDGYMLLISGNFYFTKN